MPMIVLNVLLLRLGPLILAREDVWKPLGLLRLTRSLLGGGIALRCSAVLTERLEEHQNISEANLAHGDCDDIIGVALTLR